MKEKQPEKKQLKEPTMQEKLKSLLDAGYKINEAAGACGLKRSIAQRIVDYGE